MYEMLINARANSCLIIIDVQNGFISPKTDHILPRIQSLLEEENFDHVVFTRFVNTEDSPFVRFLNWNKVSKGEEIEISSLLKPFAKTVYDKSTYTALTETLSQFIVRHSIETAFICGIDTDCCVLATAIDLFEFGIRPCVLTYYSASNGGSHSQKAAIAVLNRLIGSHNTVNHRLNKDDVL